MKRQRKNPVKKVAKKPTLSQAEVAKKLQDRAKQVPRAARLAAAEQKAARLEETLILKDRLHNELIVKWQDTIKLRDEAIERKNQWIKEQVEQLQTVASEIAAVRSRLADSEANVAYLSGIEGGWECQPTKLNFRAVLEAEIEARKRVIDENVRLLAIIKNQQDQSQEADAVIGRLTDEKQAVERELRLTEKSREEWIEKHKRLESQWMAAIEELARYNTPAQPVPEPHHQVTEWTLTFADLVEFSRLFKPREGG